MTRYVIGVDDAMFEVRTWHDLFEVVQRYSGIGRRPFRFEIGPADDGASRREDEGDWINFLDGPVLQVDIDVETGRCAAAWLPDSLVGVEPGVPSCHKDLIVCDDPLESPEIRVSAERARVTPGAALKTLAKYVETGSRPPTLEWVPGSFGALAEYFEAGKRATPT